MPAWNGLKPLKLETAALAGARVEQKDKAKWQDYVKNHKVKEAASRVLAKSISETVVPVIIDSDDEWSGYYLYSKQDNVCLKFDLGS